MHTYLAFVGIHRRTSRRMKRDNTVLSVLCLSVCAHALTLCKHGV